MEEKVDPYLAIPDTFLGAPLAGAGGLRPEEYEGRTWNLLLQLAVQRIC